MVRQLYDALTRLFSRKHRDVPAPDDWRFAHNVRVPDPYVWRLPEPHEARWRRWSKRSLATGHRLPVLQEEECWHIPAPPRTPLWSISDNLVRRYVTELSPRRPSCCFAERVKPSGVNQPTTEGGSA